MVRRSSLAAILIFAFATGVNGDDRFVRELDAYCVSKAGVRTGVAASQDGATLAYVQSPDQPAVMVRTIHSRSRVSGWHDSLDLAEFEAMRTSPNAKPYCAIERSDSGGTHIVSWPEGQTPVSLAPTFDAMMRLHD